MSGPSFDPDNGVTLPTTKELREEVENGFQNAFRVRESDNFRNYDFYILQDGNVPASARLRLFRCANHGNTRHDNNRFRRVYRYA